MIKIKKKCIQCNKKFIIFNYKEFRTGNNSIKCKYCKTLNFEYGGKCNWILQKFIKGLKLEFPHLIIK